VRRSSVALAAALALFSGCGNPPVGPGGGVPLRFTVGEITFTAASGAAVATTYGFRLFLTDQPDACDAVAFVPNGVHTILELRVAPQASGATVAVVVPPPALLPDPGQSTGGLTEANAAVPMQAYDATDGNLAWTPNADGSVTLDSVDVGFLGVGASGLHLPKCTL